MKKRLLEKDGFYLSLFICICLLAAGGVWFTNKNVNRLASNNKHEYKTSSKDDEVNLVNGNKKAKEDKNKVSTSTNSKQNLQQAKNKLKEKGSNVLNTPKDAQVNKLAFIGNKIIRDYSDKQPSYSKTLDVWEIHRAVDIGSTKGADVKSLTNGVVESVFKDDKYGNVVKINDKDKGLKIVYSNLDSNALVKKNQKIVEGQKLGVVGNLSKVESQEGPHIHLEVYKNGKLINPSEILK